MAASTAPPAQNRFFQFKPSSRFLVNNANRLLNVTRVLTIGNSWLFDLLVSSNFGIDICIVCELIREGGTKRMEIPRLNPWL